MNATIAQIIGAVVDVRFEGEVPSVLTALNVTHEGRTVVLEIAQHLGGGMVRTIAMGTTDGLTRGMEVVNTGRPISVTVVSGTVTAPWLKVNDAVPKSDKIFVPNPSLAKIEPLKKFKSASPADLTLKVIPINFPVPVKPGFKTIPSKRILPCALELEKDGS